MNVINCMNGHNKNKKMYLYVCVFVGAINDHESMDW